MKAFLPDWLSRRLWSSTDERPTCLMTVAGKSLLDDSISLCQWPALVARMYGFVIKEYLQDIGAAENYPSALREWQGFTRSTARQRAPAVCQTRN